MPFTIPNLPSASYPDQAEPDSVDFDILVRAFGLSYVRSGCAATAQATPNMTVAVASGVCIINGTYVPVTAGNATIGAADATNARFDLIYINASGTISVQAGAASANAVFPAHPSNAAVVASVYVPAGVTAITNNMIVDKRITGNEKAAPSKLVAAYNAPIGLQAVADYVCDNTADQVEIQAAHDALGANGGTILLTEGDYTTSAPITISKNNVNLVGAGWGTRIKLANSSNCYVINTTQPAADVRLGPRVAFIHFDGNRANQTSGGCLDLIGTYYARIEYCRIIECKDIHISMHNSGVGGDPYGGSNFILQCLLQSGNTGIKTTTSDFNTILNTDIGYMQASGSGYGAWLEGWNQRVIGCDFDMNDIQIKYYFVHDNTVQGCWLDRAITRHIDIEGSQGTMVQGCKLNGRRNADTSVPSAAGDGILLTNGGKGNMIIGNTWYDIENTWTYAVREAASGDSPNLVMGNYFYGNLTTSLQSTSRTLANNYNGKMSENSGTASVAAASLSIAVTHNLPATPARVTLTPTADTQGRRFWVSAKGATTFTITLDANAVTNPITFDWRATLGEG